MYPVGSQQKIAWIAKRTDTNSAVCQSVWVKPYGRGFGKIALTREYVLHWLFLVGSVFYMSIRAASLSRTATRRHERAEKALLTIGKPTEAAESEEFPTREDSCTHYQKCLTYACNKGWENFSCLGCDDFDPSTAELELAAGNIQASFVNARRD